MKTLETPEVGSPPTPISDDSRSFRVPKEALTADPGLWEAARLKRAAIAAGDPVINPLLETLVSLFSLSLPRRTRTITPAEPRQTGPAAKEAL